MFKPTSRIKRLEDRDGDGTYESFTVFADNLLLPRMISTLDGKNWTPVAEDISGKNKGKVQTLGHLAQYIRITNREEVREWRIGEIDLVGNEP